MRVSTMTKEDFLTQYQILVESVLGEPSESASHALSRTLRLLFSAISLCCNKVGEGRNSLEQLQVDVVYQKIVSGLLRNIELRRT